MGALRRIIEEIERMGLSGEDMDEVLRRYVDGLDMGGLEGVGRTLMEVYVAVNRGRLTDLLSKHPITLVRLAALGLERRGEDAVFRSEVLDLGDWCRYAVRVPKHDDEVGMAWLLINFDGKVHGDVGEMVSEMHRNMFAVKRGDTYIVPKPVLRVMRLYSSRVRFSYEVDVYRAIRWVLNRACGHSDEIGGRAAKILKKISGGGGLPEGDRDSLIGLARRGLEHLRELVY